MDGVESIQAFRRAIGRNIPAVILTGETRSLVVNAIAEYDISVVNKPVQGDELLTLIRQLTDQPDSLAQAQTNSST
jgi:DNA-binding NtrC family response regulator